MKQSLYLKLTEVRRIKEQIKELKCKKDSLYSLLLPSGIAYDKDKVKTSPEDPMLKTYAKISVIEDSITEKQAELMQAVDRVCNIIKELPGAKERMIFYMWYIECLNAKQIRDKLDYMSEDTVYKLHRKGIKKLEEKLFRCSEF